MINTSSSSSVNADETHVVASCDGNGLNRFASGDEAARAIARGEPVIVLDSPNRENEGDIIIAARHATPERVADMLRRTTGIVCATLPAVRAAALDLPPMVAAGDCPHGTAFTQSVDARVGTTTGVSATERSLTLRMLADSNARPSDFVRPGHVFPLAAREGGLAERRGHTEAGVALCTLAGIDPPVAAISELVDPMTHEMLRLDGCAALARTTGMLITTVDLIKIAVDAKAQHVLVDAGVSSMCNGTHVLGEKTLAADTTPTKEKDGDGVRCVAECTIPVSRDGVDLGEWRLQAWSGPRGHDSDHTHVMALIKGDVSACGPILVRIHSECFTGNVLGSQRCDCNDQLTSAMSLVAEHGRGVVLYVQGHEGRGIGLVAKLRAYRLQTESALDTYAANRALGLPDECRDFATARAVLQHGLGIDSVRLITNNPAKADALTGFISEIVPSQLPPTRHSARYLQDKRAVEAAAVARSLHASLFDAATSATGCSDRLPETACECSGVADFPATARVDVLRM